MNTRGVCDVFKSCVPVFKINDQLMIKKQTRVKYVLFNIFRPKWCCTVAKYLLCCMRYDVLFNVEIFIEDILITSSDISKGKCQFSCTVFVCDSCLCC